MIKARTKILLLVLAVLAGCGRTSTGPGGVATTSNQGTGTGAGTPPRVHAFVGTVDPLAAPFGAGDGSVADPYQICTVAQLQAVHTASPAYSYLLLTDLDLTGAPIFPTTGFTGTFDGHGHKLANYSGYGPLF